MSEYNQDAIEAANLKLVDELEKNEGDQLTKEAYKAVCEVSRFWSDYLYSGASLYEAEFKLLSELDGGELAQISHALAIHTIIRSDFWNGNEDNLDKIPTQFQNRIKKAAGLILECSKNDADSFGEKS